MTDKVDIEKRKIAEKYYPLSMTKEDETNFANQKTCEYCNKPFDHSNTKNKHKHHCHYTEPDICKETKEVKTGNYRGAACLKCKTEMTNKRRLTTCVFS